MAEDEYVTIKKDVLQRLCTDVADFKPVIEHSFGKTIWSCMLTAKKSRFKNLREWHCTECPVLDLCPCDGKVIHKDSKSWKDKR